jgi:hypothetical protein
MKKHKSGKYPILLHLNADVMDKLNILAAANGTERKLLCEDILTRLASKVSNSATDKLQESLNDFKNKENI